VLRGLTQRELAMAARVDPGTLSDALSRRRRPTLPLQAICQSLNLTLADVIRFEDEGRA
jgi:transcriptional regulator with XRE-family HTH domain